METEERDTLLDDIKSMEMPQTQKTEQITPKRTFYERNQKPLFFLLFATCLINGICFVALIL